LVTLREGADFVVPFYPEASSADPHALRKMCAFLRWRPPKTKFIGKADTAAPLGCPCARENETKHVNAADSFSIKAGERKHVACAEACERS
jgi:hypothetical protein